MHVQNHSGQTALHKAGGGVRADAVAALLAAGAYVHMRTNNGETALHCAGERGSAAVVAALLAGGAHVDAQTNGVDTALLLAGTRGRIGTVAALLAGGADVHVRDRTGETALYKASRSGLNGKVVVLLAAGADTNPNGWTPLHVAVDAEVRRTDRVAECATLGGSVRVKLYGWRGVVLALLLAGADGTGLERRGAELCARLSASVPLLGPRQAVRLRRAERSGQRVGAGIARAHE